MAADNGYVPEMKKERFIHFGPQGAIAGTITESHTPQAKAGAVLWGLGLPEIKAARHLATHGIVSLQIKVNGREFAGFKPEYFEKRNAIYDAHGVSYSKAAMDTLAAERKVERFVLMGNCACANICFNTALTDSRVIGLILTNPYVSQIQVLSTSFWGKLFRKQTLIRVLTGRTRISVKVLKAVLVNRLRRKAGKGAVTSPSDAYEYRGDLSLPANFGEKLKSLSERGIKTLLVCSAAEDGWQYLKKTYREEFDILQAQGNLRLAEVNGDTHVFAESDAAADRLNEAIATWSETSLQAHSENIDQVAATVRSYAEIPRAG